MRYAGFCRAACLFIAPFLAGSGRAAVAPTFDKDVAPVFFKNCIQCHRDGEIASGVSFISYDSTRPWAKSIREKVVRREMPPWSADAKASLKFRNDPRLSQKDIDTIAAWVDGGALRGNDADLPAVPAIAEGWLHPKGLPPDLVISFSGTVHIPAKGDIPYLRHLVKVPTSEDKWVVASQLQPGNRALVHHMAVTEVVLNDGETPATLETMGRLARQMGLAGGPPPARPAIFAPGDPVVFDMMGMYTPGSTFEMYDADSARLLKGGGNYYLNFNIHYQVTGKPEIDRPSIGLWFQTEPPKHQLYRIPAAAQTILAGGKELLSDAPGRKAEGTQVAIPPIPPYADNYEVIGVTGYKEPVTIYQLQPHAHLRGKDFRYVAVYPDGREQTLLSVPKFDFNWQLAYELETPLKLPAGSTLVVTAHYDNSANNKANPAPGKEVYFREENQSWDEMFTPFVQYSIERGEKALNMVEVVGCLEQGPSAGWELNRAGAPMVTTNPGTSAAALKEAATKPLGEQRYLLTDAGLFSPSSLRGERVAVRGLAVGNGRENRLNLTSLQPLAGGCEK